MAISSWMLRSASSSKRRRGLEISRKLPMAKPWCSTKISVISWISINWFWILSGLVIGTKSRNSAWACSVCRYSVNWSLTLLNSNWSKIFVFIASIIAHPVKRGGVVEWIDLLTKIVNLCIFYSWLFTNTVLAFYCMNYSCQCRSADLYCLWK